MTDNRAKAIIDKVAKKQIEQKFGSVANAITAMCGRKRTNRKCENCKWFKERVCTHICQTNPLLDCNKIYRPWYERIWWKIGRPI